MKNSFLTILTLALLFSAPLFSEKLVLDDEEDRTAPVADVSPTAVQSVKPAAAKATAVLTPVKTAVPTVAATPKPAGTQDDELNSKVENMKGSLNNAIAANSDMAADIRELKSDIRRIEERSMEIKGISQDMEEYKQRLKQLEDKYVKDKEATDKALDDFGTVKTNLKASVDKLSSWSDILEVLKKGISDNELEIARLKKIINDLKLKYGENDDNIFGGILRWPYAGFTALVLSIVAFSVAIAK
jgi:DNA repair ATPase RecN